MNVVLADERNSDKRKMKNALLKIDALVNFILGVLLLMTAPYPQQMAELLGVPGVEQGFYPSIMGGVFIGIGIGLLLETNRRKDDPIVGLGLAGAIAINLCGGAVLMGWLLFGDLDIAGHGSVFLWGIAVVLVGISTIELISIRRGRKERNGARDV